MICEKCLHREVCDQSSRQIWSGIMGEIECSDFMDESKYVEMAHRKWISCSERLPKYDEKSEYYKAVIVTLDTGRVADGCYRNHDKEWWVDAEDGEHYSINATGRVVAWQPYPEPYNPNCGAKMDGGVRNDRQSDTEREIS